MSMRAFVAIVPPRAVLDAVGKVSWRAAHRPAEVALPRLLGPRWTTRDKWHLTLQFLGTRVDLAAAAAALTATTGAQRVRLGGIGGFPSERRASVVWVGVIEGAGAVTALAAAVLAAMAPWSVPPTSASTTRISPWPGSRERPTCGPPRPRRRVHRSARRGWPIASFSSRA